MTIREKAIGAMAAELSLADPDERGLPEGEETVKFYRKLAAAAFDVAVIVLMDPDAAMVEAGSRITLDEKDEPCPELARYCFTAMLKATSQ